MNKKWLIGLCLLTYLIRPRAQDTLIIGFGDTYGTIVSASSSNGQQSPENTMDASGFLPNESAASRFLSQAALGYDFADIQEVMVKGRSLWIDEQMAKPVPFRLQDRVAFYHDFARTNLGDPNTGTRSGWWDNAWWHYHMSSDDLLRQKVAFALSELLVISEISGFGTNPYPLAAYYDIFLENAFTNYRTILQKVTYNPAMGLYLTYLNNPKSDPAQNRFPDENYSREVMQLFTLGTVKLNMDGSVITDNQGVPVPTYDNEDIFELSKVFTGLTWWDRTQFYRGALNNNSYLQDMVMWETYHEPGPKNLLNGYVIPDRNPINGNADISDALDHLFNHPNTPPFISYYLIQRLVTSNPSPGFVEDISNVFVNNGSGVRGDMKAIIKAILTHPEASSCQAGEEAFFGALREPFNRYMQLNRALKVSTTSGVFRNEMNNVYNFTGQRPLSSPSVFNFFQRDYSPIGPATDNDKVAPEFQITNAQSIAGYLSGLWEWIVDNNPADENDLYTNEDNNTYVNEVSRLDFLEDLPYTDNDKVHILIDKYNMLLAQGNLGAETVDIIIDAVKALPNGTDTEKERKARFVAYLVMASPEYVINK